MRTLLAATIIASINATKLSAEAEVEHEVYPDFVDFLGSLYSRSGPSSLYYSIYPDEPHFGTFTPSIHHVEEPELPPLEPGPVILPDEEPEPPVEEVEEEEEPVVDETPEADEGDEDYEDEEDSLLATYRVLYPSLHIDF